MSGTQATASQHFTPGTGRPFLVRGYPTDASLPPLEEPFSRFGPAFDRAQQLASALGYRSADITDLNGTLYAQLNLLWAIPRELR